jgi:hypothetical protein
MLQHLWPYVYNFIIGFLKILNPFGVYELMLTLSIF